VTVHGGVKVTVLLALLWLGAPAAAQPPAAANAPAAAGAPAAAPATPRPRPRPAIWLLADHDTKIFLFGTYHILPHDFQWRSPLFNDIVRRSDELVLEVADRGNLQSDAAARRPMMLGKEAPILWRVSPDRREALAEMVAGLGVPIGQFDGLQTWSVALGLAAAQIVRTVGGEGETLAELPGVEDLIEAEFRAAHRPVSGVETAAQQMGFFAAMSFAEQRGFLESMVDEYRRGSAAPDTIGEDDWVRGDVDSIAVESRAMPGPLYEALLRRRNAAWTDWLAARLERPGTLLFAVGAAHLAGPDSVQAMLAARGLEARRIQ